jgi:adenosylhomocysteine nucleosidase
VTSAGPLIVMALPSESQGQLESAGAAVLYTGVGKVNAAYHLTRALTHARGNLPSLVVNFGTAGSAVHPPGTLIGCNRFAQRDMDVTGLGFAPGCTPFEPVPAELQFPTVFAALRSGGCASADRFEIARPELSWDALDMESYALAKVCWLEGMVFACAKYISDGADDSAAHDWHSNLHPASKAFAELYRWLRDQKLDLSR